MTSRTKYLLTSTVLDFVFLSAGFLLFTWVFPGTLTRLIPELWQPFLAWTALWLIISLISGKYIDPHRKSLQEMFVSLLVSGLTMLIVTLVLVFVFGANKKTIFIAIGTGSFAFVIESFWIIWLYSRIRYMNETGNKSWLHPILYPELLEEGQNELDSFLPADKKLTLEGFNQVSFLQELSGPALSIQNYLRGKYLDRNPALFEFISGNLLADQIEKNRSQVLETANLFNLRTVEEGTQELIINFHRLNDVRRINEFLIQVNKNLMPGGWFVCCALTLENRREQFLKRFSFPVNRILYVGDFLINRVAPKMPFSKEIYFMITKGKSRVISQSEILGRLYYCGFEKVAKTEIDGDYYILAQKIWSHRRDPNPSYGPFVKMRRIGKDGLVIPIYKVRTMYPYSEYIQDYIYKTNKLEESGKFRDDFRITTWGRIFRKLWIDELPQLLNLYRGQLKIVGVRAISRHYFQLYPKDLQALRIKTKPGLIPPYYYDRPQSFSEICESERRYIESWMKHPLRTDWRYFWGAFYNIVFRRARSK